VLICALGLCVTATGVEFAGGTGEADNPYQIATAEQLIGLGQDPNLYDRHFILIGDIDLDPNLPGGQVFDEPLIGRGWPHYQYFRGSLDGQGHVIRNLVMHTSPYEDSAGLFYAIADVATVTNLGLVDVEILAERVDGVGALAGSSSGTVSGCYSTGRVEGGDRTGGLIGACGGYGSDKKLQQCWSSVSVKGERYTGGLAGSSNMEVFSCFATGDVKGYWGSSGALVGFSRRVGHCYATGKVSGSGGLVGYTDNCIVASYCTGGESLTRWANGILLSYHLAENPVSGLDRTEEEMKDPATFRGWGYGSQWVLNAGQDTPRLVWEGTPGVPITDDPNRYGGGAGTVDDPYQIWTAGQMAAIAWHPVDYDKHFILMTDVDMAVLPPEDLLPIGTYRFGFTGVLDGQHHVVSNFRYHATVPGNAGLFGMIDSGAVRYLHLVDVEVSGNRTSGALAAHNSGTIESCSVTGTVGVTGSWYSGYAGGLVGYTTGRIARCAAATHVQGTSYTGGLAGKCGGGQIVQCASTGSAEGGKVAGGLIGLLQSSNDVGIESCYSICEVQGQGQVGGLIGSGSTGLLSTSYFAGRVFLTETEGETADQSLGGVIGKNDTVSIFLCYWDVESCGLAAGGTGSAKSPIELTMASTFRGWGWDGAWVLDEGQDYPRLAWEGTGGMPIVDDPLRYAGGRGEPNDPYRIETAGQLANVGYHRTDFDKHFVLVNDIDLSVLAEGRVVPIGRHRLPFSGSFDGAGHTLGDLRMLLEEDDFVGLFGFIGTSDTDSAPMGEIKHLRVEDANVVGRETVGILAGQNTGTVAYCEVVGSVVADNGAGALVGVNLGVVRQSYASADVNCPEYAGGLVGRNEGVIDQSGSRVALSVQRYGGGLAGYSVFGQIVNCMAAGSISGGPESYHLGGLVGNISHGPISNCYAAVSVTAGEEYNSIGGLVGGGSLVTNSFFLHPDDGGGPDNGIGFATADAALCDPTTFAGWDFLGSARDGTSEVWMMPQAGGPPVLSALQGIRPVDLPGGGTADDPYLVASAEQLGAIACAPDASYRLVDDIDLSEILWTTPVIPAFGGSLEGDGHGITGLSMATGSCGGLIGLLQAGGGVAGLTIADAAIIGVSESQWLGILAGVNKGSVVDCQVTGVVMGTRYLGGLVGKNDYGTVSLCGGSAFVVGDYYLGGLIGENLYGTITDCYAWGNVNGSGGYVGGLVGSNQRGTLERCYAAAGVTGKSGVGGLAGDSGDDAVITDCYFLHADDGGGPDNGLGTALTEDQMQQPSSFAGWSFQGPDGGADDTTWVVSPDAPYPVLVTYVGYAPPDLPGNGTASDPYRIASADQLTAIARDSEAHYRLVQDLDLAGTEWLAAPVAALNGSFDGAGHTIRNLQVTAGMNGGLFGLLGDRAIVANLRMENAQVTGLAGAENLGLLAGVNGGTIRRCYTTGSVTGGQLLGGLVGVNRSGMITECESEASVNGTSFVGGLVGRSVEGVMVRCAGRGNVTGDVSVGGLIGDNRGVVLDCYHDGSVAGVDKVGGLLGSNAGLVQATYASGAVRGDPDSNDVGALVGSNTGTIAGSYFGSAGDLPNPDNDLGIPLTEAQMKRASSYAAWDFFGTAEDGSREVWFLPDQGLPVLAWQRELSGLVWLTDVQGATLELARARLESAGLVLGAVQYDYDAAIPAERVIGLAPAHPVAPGTTVDIVVSLGAYDWQADPGDGTRTSPYEIRTVGQLDSLAQCPELWDKCFVLSSDIDLSGRVYTNALLGPETDRAKSGFQGTPFTGSFDGRGFAVAGLTVASVYEYVGLFGKIDPAGQVENLVVRDAVVVGRIGHSSGRRRCGTGALAGESWGAVRYCGSTGVVVGSGDVGGLVGKSGGSVADSYHHGLVAGTARVGGLVGTNVGSVTDSYSTAWVMSNDYVGGLVGVNSYDGDRFSAGASTHLRRCYASGPVTAPVDAEHVGSLIGDGSYGTVADCYFLTPEEGLGADNGWGTPLSDVQMRERESFAAWSFFGDSRNDGDSHWVMPAVGYPALSWQTESTGLQKTPTLLGLSAEEARVFLEGRGLVMGDIVYDFHRVLPADVVITAVDRYVRAGDPVDLLVSLGAYDWATNPGAGTEADPYTIATAGQLESLLDHPELCERHFRLVADLDMWGRTFSSAVIPGDFGGTFDGAGHRIRCLRFVPEKGDSYAGLFGRLVGHVMDLGLEDVRITVGKEVSTWQTPLVVGPLAGQNIGTVERCFAAGDIVGSASETGGLIGVNWGAIQYCYSQVNIESVSSDSDAIGGIAAENHGTITNCYAVGFIPPDRSYCGPIVGDNGYYSNKGAVSRCLWDMETTGVGVGLGGLGLPSAQMMDADCLSLNGWAADTNWIVDDHNDYPRLLWEETPGRLIPEPATDWLAGTGMWDDPYLIETPSQLARLGSASVLWSEDFLLVNDLDMTGVHMLPIGIDYDVPFSGAFDGGHHVIRNLTMTHGRSGYYVGFFGCVRVPRRVWILARSVSSVAAAGGCVVNLNIQDANVAGEWGVGILAGRNYGAISGCVVSGSVAGGGDVGGLVGSNSDGSITNCGASVTVSGYYDDLGGLVGDNWDSTITHCYATGNVFGQDRSDDLGGLIGLNDGEAIGCYATGNVSAGERCEGVGGLVGSGVNSGDLIRCYSTGTVTVGEASQDVGGLIGACHHRAETTDCFWDQETSGLAASAGGMGLSTLEMRTRQTFVDAGWDFTGETENGTEDIWTICEGEDYPRLWWEEVVCER